MAKQILRISAREALMAAAVAPLLLTLEASSDSFYEIGDISHLRWMQDVNAEHALLLTWLRSVALRPVRIEPPCVLMQRLAMFRPWCVVYCGPEPQSLRWLAAYLPVVACVDATDQQTVQAAIHFADVVRSGFWLLDRCNGSLRLRRNAD